MVWDGETGRPLHNAVVWLDARTKPTVERLVAKGGKGQDALRDKCAFGFQKDSELRPIFNYYIAKLSEEGLLKKIVKDGLPSTAQGGTALGEAGATTTRLGYPDLVFPFMALALGVVASSVFGLLEKFSRALMI